MKQFFFTIFICLITSAATGQITYHPLNLEFDTTVVDNYNTTSDSVDINTDGQYDFRIDASIKDAPQSKHVKLYFPYYIDKPSTIETNLYSTIATNPPAESVHKCGTGGPTLDNEFGILYSNLVDEKFFSSGDYNVKFKVNLQDTLYNGMLCINYTGSKIKVKGYYIGDTPTTLVNCGDIPANAGIKELTLPAKTGPYKYYDLIGQEVQNPKGLVIKVYETGATEKIYIQ